VAERVLFVVFVLALAGHVVWLALLPPSWWMIPAALVAWFLADLGSGLTHILLDYVPCRSGIGLQELYFYDGSRGTPEYRALRSATMQRAGPLQQVLFDNKIHHPRPWFLARRAITSLLFPNILFYAVPFLVCEALLILVVPVSSWLVTGVTVLLTGAVFSQYTHALSHRAQVAWPVKVAQRARVFLRPREHAGHHAHFDRNFCLLSGWANPLVNPVFTWALRRGWLHPAGLEPS
jgi:hypothetical protein